MEEARAMGRVHVSRTYHSLRIPKRIAELTYLTFVKPGSCRYRPISRRSSGKRPAASRITTATTGKERGLSPSDVEFPARLLGIFHPFLLYLLLPSERPEFDLEIVAQRGGSQRHFDETRRKIQAPGRPSRQRQKKREESTCRRKSRILPTLRLLRPTSH